MQMDVQKTLFCFYTSKKIPHDRMRSICIYFEIFFKWSYGLYEFATITTLLNWCINVVIIVNSTQRAWNELKLAATTFAGLSFVCADWI